MKYTFKVLTLFTGLTAILFVLFVFNINSSNGSSTPAFGSVSNLNIETLNNWRAAGGFTRELQPGNHGADVSYLQTYLRSIYPKSIIRIDGVFGIETINALALFQKDASLPITGMFDKETKEKINQLFIGALCPKGDVTYADTLLLPISKTQMVDRDYAPSDLVVLPERVVTNGIICLRSEAADAYIRMTDAARTQGLVIRVTSGFRNFEIQEYLFNFYTKLRGIAYASRVSALPGHSEHQLGTTVDLTGASLRYISTSHSFAQSSEGKWLAAHAGEYGFVLSYPRGKESITGYTYEPWHYRYVGIAHAEALKSSGQTLKEYLENLETIEQL